MTDIDDRVASLPGLTSETGYLTEMVSTFSLQQSYSGVRERLFGCSCRNIMLRKDELEFMKAISTYRFRRPFSRS